MLQAVIKHNIVKWARERANLNEAEIAKSLNVNKGKYLSWEKGETLPSFRQAQKLAKKLRIPFGYLYLDTPPKQEVQIPDLRTIHGGISDLSPDFRELLNSVLRKQQWLSSFLKEEGELPQDFVGKYSVYSDPVEVSLDIMRVVGINKELTKNSSSWTDYLSMLTKRADEVGIMALRNGVVGNNTNRSLAVSEFRGFALCDAFAPLIFINANDSKAAQIFTFAHELAHLWIGKSGVSNFDESEETGDSSIEDFCNQVAAEILVPRHDFQKVRVNSDTVDRLATHFRVSTIVVLRRAYDLKMISKRDFIEMVRIQKSKQKPTKKSRAGGGDFCKILAARHSPLLIRSIINSVLEGRTLYREAALILDVKADTFYKIARNME